VNASVPTALAVAGTALMAVAIFGPFHRTAGDDSDESAAAIKPHSDGKPWTALVDPSALACDVPARIDLAEALGALQSAWAAAILRQALEIEADAAVRSAISTALSSSQSLVT
jgi:hypothetical protein